MHVRVDSRVLVAVTNERIAAKTLRPLPHVCDPKVTTIEEFKTLKIFLNLDDFVSSLMIPERKLEDLESFYSKENEILNSTCWLLGQA